MGRTLTLGLAATAVFGLTGCAGVPMVVTAASVYVDTVLTLRTGRTAKDLVISAVADRDCAFGYVLTRGRLCEDGPPPQLLAEVMREVETVSPSGDRAAREPAEGRVVMAAADALVLSDAAPSAGAAPLPTAIRPGPAAEAALRTDGKPLLVVVGSFTKRAQAEAQRASIAHPSMDIVEATVFGKRHYRVVIRPADREDALRQLATVRAAGIRDAWLLPWSGTLAVGDAVAALPALGWLYRI